MEENAEAREDMILGLIALTSDLPTKLLHLLPGSVEWSQKTVRTLERDKLLKRHQKNGITSLRLTKRGRDMLIHAFPERFAPLFTDAYLARCRKSDPVSLERMHRAAAVNVLMQQAGTRLYPDEKPAVFAATEAPVQLPPSPCFYSSLEVKARGIELTRIQATRAMGVLLNGHGDGYLVYHTGASPLKWSSKAEQKLMGAVRGILLGRRAQLTELQAVMIGSHMGTALDLLRSEGGHRRQNFRLDGTFPAFYFVPCDARGVRQVRLLGCPAARETLTKLLRGGREVPKSPRYDCDALMDNMPVLFACEFDMEKLRRFRNGLELFGEHGIVCCFDYQADCLAAYLDGLAQVRPVAAEKIEKELTYGA